MKLTKAQHEYIERKLRDLYYNKRNEILKKYPCKSLYKYRKEILEKYPKKIQNAMILINQQINADFTAAEEELKPYDKMHKKAQEQLLFAENYESVQQLIKDFGEQLK